MTQHYIETPPVISSKETGDGYNSLVDGYNSLVVMKMFTKIIYLKFSSFWSLSIRDIF